MKTNVFVKTKNVKRFVGLMEDLKKLPPNIPKLALVFGDHGLGKTKTLLWWATKNDAIYIRANNDITQNGLLKNIMEELEIKPFHAMQDNYNEIILIQKRSVFLMTSQQLTPQNSPISISYVADFLANLFRLQEKDEDLKTQEAQCFLKSHGFSKTKNPNILFSKTLKAYLITMEEELSKQYLKFSPTLGIKCNGNYLILSSSAFLKTENVSTLLDVMETNVSEKYFLSAEQTKKILSRAKRKK